MHPYRNLPHLCQSDIDKSDLISELSSLSLRADTLGHQDLVGFSHYVKGRVYIDRDLWSESLTEFQYSVDVLNKLEESEYLADALNYLGYVSMFLVDPKTGLEHSTTSLDVSVNLNYTYGRALAHNTRYMAYNRMGLLNLAEFEANEYLRLSIEMDNEANISTAHYQNAVY